MDNKPSLSQYFGDTDAPPASQFFDEIGTAPSDMIQSVYLGDSEGVNAQTTTANLFPQNMTASFTQHRIDQDVTFTNVVPTVSGSSALPATALPDPSTFFDTIGPEPQIGPAKSGLVNPIQLTEAMEGLTVKNQPVDKEADRRRDAWLPNEEAKKTLMKAQSSPKGSFFPEREVLTMPGIILEEELPDALQEVAVKYLGVSTAGSRGVVRAEHVTRDEAGLRELLRTGCLRAALNLTHTLLQAAQQGVGRVNRPSKHSPRTLQLWLTRFSVMLRIKLYEPLVQEAEAFGDFSKPDMFYEFYPDTYEGRKGSLVPFSLRLLVAELPGHVDRPEHAVDRLYHMLDIINTMLANLRAGKTEDGSGTVTDADRDESIRLWEGRKTRTLHSIVNWVIALKDYRTASEILQRMRDAAPPYSAPAPLAAPAPAPPSSRRALSSALCRLWLLAGHVKAAQAHFEDAREARHHICPTPDVRELVDLGLIDIALGRYQDAYSNFARAADQEPTNIMVANNLSVCLLYMGRLKEAIAVLQKAINSDPERGLNESLLINLCTLYELESSKTNEKKLNLLRMLCKYKSDTIPNVLECLKLS